MVGNAVAMAVVLDSGFLNGLFSAGKIQVDNLIIFHQSGILLLLFVPFTYIHRKRKSIALGDRLIDLPRGIRFAFAVFFIRDPLRDPGHIFPYQSVPAAVTRATGSAESTVECHRLKGNRFRLRNGFSTFVTSSRRFRFCDCLRWNYRESVDHGCKAHAIPFCRFPKIPADNSETSALSVRDIAAIFY